MELLIGIGYWELVGDNILQVSSILESWTDGMILPTDFIGHIQVHFGFRQHDIGCKANKLGIGYAVKKYFLYII
nr:hypothetical protein [Mediterraneibacter glycyrrhizinilyticus]